MPLRPGLWTPLLEITCLMQSMQSLDNKQHTKVGALGCRKGPLSLNLHLCVRRCVFCACACGCLYVCEREGDSEREGHREHKEHKLPLVLGVQACLPSQFCLRRSGLWHVPCSAGRFLSKEIPFTSEILKNEVINSSLALKLTVCFVILIRLANKCRPRFNWSGQPMIVALILYNSGGLLEQ